MCSGTRPTNGNYPRGGSTLPAASISRCPSLFFWRRRWRYTPSSGRFLGALGAYLSIDPRVQAGLLLGIGIFMVGNALRMLNVHPVFRFFSVEPPKFITRYIRRTARDGADRFTPLFLGALTVLIPCGVTQTMMAAALAAGNPASGAALMFAFTLGTTPVFFAVAYFATALGARLEALFMRFVAVALLVLGAVSINSGLTLVGSPLAVGNIVQALAARNSPSLAAVPEPLRRTLAAEQTPADSTGEDSSAVRLSLAAINSGYVPAVLHAPANRPITLILLTEGTVSCARAFVIPALSYQTLLPETGSVPVEIPAQPAGTVLRFACSMGMYTGQIVFDG